MVFRRPWIGDACRADLFVEALAWPSCLCGTVRSFCREEPSRGWQNWLPDQPGDPLQYGPRQAMNQISPPLREHDAGLSAISDRSLAPAAPQLGRRRRALVTPAITAAVLSVASASGFFAWHRFGPALAQTPATAPQAPPQVTVARPLKEVVAPTTSFLGQFSAVDSVEVRAQVGGTLARIAFRDGQIVHKGDLLFTIDPRPYQIRLEQAAAQLHMALGRKALADAELWRSQQLRQSSFGTVEAVDQRASEQRSAEANVLLAQAAIRDAQLDLEFSQMTAPFEGKIGNHLASVGSLVSGSRAGAGPSTLLATVVSLDPIHIDFDLSETDFLAYQLAHKGLQADETVGISLDGSDRTDISGTLDFIDNVIDRSSGTVHARATVPNPDLSLTPGQFARVRVPLGRPVPALLVPAAAVIPDQSQQIVMTVGPDGKIVPKMVETGALHHGLRIIRTGLNLDDRIVINGLVRARPGAVVTPVAGTITPTQDEE